MNSDTSYEEFDLVLEEIIESYKLAAKKIYLGAQSGRKVSTEDIDALTWVNSQITFVHNLKILRNLGREPLAEGLEAMKALHLDQNSACAEAIIALCDRLLLTFSPCELRRSIHTKV